MRAFYFKGNSIMKKMMVPMMIVLLIQAALFLGTILSAGTVHQLDSNAFDILTERVINRKTDLENKMIQYWSNLDDTVSSVNQIVNQTLASRQCTIQQVQTDPAVANQILKASAAQLVDLLRRQGVTDAYLILNGVEGFEPPQTGSVFQHGLHIRDMDPSSYPSNNSDLLLECAPPSLVKDLGFAMDTYWQAQYEFSADYPERSAFYYKPLEAALHYPGTDSRDLGYWCPTFRLNDNDRTMITYSVPLIDREGYPYGVLGVGVSSDYLRRMLPYSDLDQNKEGGYILAVTNDQEHLNTVVSSGPVYKKLFGDGSFIALDPKPERGSVHRFVGEDGKAQNAYGCVRYLQLYNSHTPFEQDQWALVGVIEESALLGFSQRMERILLLALSVSLVLGCISVLLISRVSTNPIVSLVKRVRQSDPMLPVQLGKINIQEIDELALAIEHLSRDVADSASKLAQIIDLTSTPIGAFEYRLGSAQVFCTDRFFEILGYTEGTCQRFYEVKLFQSLLSQLEQRHLDDEASADRVRVYRLESASGGARWARMKVVRDQVRVIGVAEDITQEMLEKRKIEYERDYDILTSLLNRRAFHRSMEQLFARPERLGVAALMMLDLDNLKYINDTYGHDLGDQYICCMARILKQYSPDGAVLSRMSGDEFHVFLYGCQSQGEVREWFDAVWSGMQRTEFRLPDGSSTRVRASAGVAWYPENAVTVEQLIRYADFAMYKVKNTIKGEYTEFDLESYQRDSYLLHSKEELNRLIEEELVEYHFQPIVDAKTGAIYAYEALMRSKLPALRSPVEILTLARSQSKLYQIERLTWFLSLRAFASHSGIAPDCHLFVNSVASQVLADKDVAELERLYGPYLNRVVLEMTEEDKIEDTFARYKQATLQRWGGMLALDDFGTGYNGESALLYLNPQFVKADISIVRDINRDTNRRELLRNLVTYSHERGIRVIAEGVETREELETLVGLQVDYLQGYYLSRPFLNPPPVSPEAREAIRNANAARPSAPELGSAAPDGENAYRERE